MPEDLDNTIVSSSSNGTSGVSLPQTLANAAQLGPPISDLAGLLGRTRLALPSLCAKALDAAAAINLTMSTERGSWSFYSNALGAVSSTAGALQGALQVPALYRGISNNIFKRVVDVSFMDQLSRMSGVRAEACAKFYFGGFRRLIPTMSQFMTDVVLNTPSTRHSAVLRVHQAIKTARMSASLQGLRYGSNAYHRSAIEAVMRGAQAAQASVARVGTLAERLGYVGLIADIGLFGMNSYLLWRILQDRASDDKRRADAMVAVTGSTLVVTGGLLVNFPGWFQRLSPGLFRSPGMAIGAGLTVILTGKLLLSVESQARGWASSRVAPLIDIGRTAVGTARTTALENFERFCEVSEAKLEEASTAVVQLKAKAKVFWESGDDMSHDDMARFLALGE